MASSRGATRVAEAGRSVAGCRHRQFWRPADALQAPAYSAERGSAWAYVELRNLHSKRSARWTCGSGWSRRRQRWGS